VILYIVVLNQRVSVSCGKNVSKSEVSNKKIKGLSESKEFLVNFLPGQGQATKVPNIAWKSLKGVPVCFFLENEPPTKITEASWRRARFH